MLDFADLFCGGGFGARGAVRGGGNPVFAVDAWDVAAKTYQENFPGAVVINDLIENVSPKNLKGKFSIDVLLTSPECTSHSIARGAKPSCEKSKETAISIIPWAKALKPRWIIVENVARMKRWDRHIELVRSIEKMGYTVSEMMLNAAEFGTPQARKRLFLIADRFGNSISEQELHQVMPSRKQSAKDIIDWSNRYKSRPLYSDKRAKATVERAERAISQLGSNIPFIIVYYGSDYAGGWQSINSPLRTITTLDRFGLVTWKDGVPYLRMLQPDELLNAMGAGNGHILPIGNRREKVKLCGNGVCSPVMEAIFRKLDQMKTLSLGQAAE